MSTPPRDRRRASIALRPDGQSATIFEPQELQVQSLLVDKSGAVYAATAPDGKVYRILHPSASGHASKADTKSSVAASWSATPYFDPGTKYIWDIALDNAGNLYVATGDHGEIYKVTRQRPALRFSSRATKSTFACSRSIPRET